MLIDCLKTVTSTALIRHLYIVQKRGVITRAKNGSALSIVGARKDIRSMEINTTAI